MDVLDELMSELRCRWWAIHQPPSGIEIARDHPAWLKRRAYLYLCHSGALDGLRDTDAIVVSLAISMMNGEYRHEYSLCYSVARMMMRG